MNKELADIETNTMNNWADMAAVKRELWNKLHSVKNNMQQGIINLA